MIIKGRNGYMMIDHEPSCQIFKAGYRACDCGIYIPFVFATQDWSQWVLASDDERQKMQDSYRLTIQEELATATYGNKLKDKRLLRLHALQLEIYRR